MSYLTSIINDEAKLNEEMQNIRSKFDPKVFDGVRINSREEAYKKGLETVNKVLRAYDLKGLDIKNIEPGHGVGHLVRDSIYASLLLQNLDIDPKHLFTGFVGGVLHDTGCALINRYHESEKSVRHAELGAILFSNGTENFKKEFLNDDEKTAIAWGIAAHTHYLKPFDVKGKDRQTRHVEPYQDLYEDGTPILGVWLPRWVDRLDATGPTMIGRHYLTQAEKHKDYDGEKFYDVEFEKHMQPVIRTKEERDGKNTMLEHLQMFVDTQNNESPYGKHDAGYYTLIRSSNKRRLQRIIDSAQIKRGFLEKERENIDTSWDNYLLHNIEPSGMTQKHIYKLRGMFEELGEEVKDSWRNCFLTTMKEYKQWSDTVLDGIKNLPEDNKILPSIISDVRSVITPFNNWTDLIKDIE